MLWAHTYGAGTHETLAAGRQTPEGGFILAGSAESFSPTATLRGIYLVRTDTLGMTDCYRQDTLITGQPLAFTAVPLPLTTSIGGSEEPGISSSDPYGSVELLCSSLSVPSTPAAQAAPVVAPVPASGLLTVTSSVPVGSLTLTDLTGKPVYHLATGPALRLTADVSHLPAGVYFYTIQGKAMYRGKLVVQH